jgi:hypothetical protein
MVIGLEGFNMKHIFQGIKPERKYMDTKQLAPEQTPLPKELEGPMYLWREWGAPLPQGYIEWHKNLALTNGKAMLKDYIIHAESMVNDGWGDGMRFIQLIVEHKKTNKLFKLKWADNQRWYAHSPSGGWILFDPEKGN